MNNPAGLTIGTSGLSLGGAGTVSLSGKVIGSGASSLTKDGEGTATFASYSGSTLGNGGTGTNISINAGTMWFSTGYFNASPFGYRTLCILVNSGGTLRLNASHALGGDNADYGTSWGQVWVRGGTLDVNGDEYVSGGTANGLGRLVLQGGTVIGAGCLRCPSTGTIISTLATNVASVINATSGGGGVQIAYANMTFDVARGTAAEDLIVSSVISGSYGFTKANSGIMVCAGANTYNGPTTVNGGTLLLTGSSTAASAVTVNAGTLGGNGYIGGPTTNAAGGTLQPGLGGLDTSTLTIANDLTLSGNALFALNRTNAQNAAQVAGIGTVYYGGTLTVTNVGDAVQAGDTFILFAATSYSGDFTTINLPPLSGGLQWQWTPTSGTLTVVTPSIPVITGVALGLAAASSLRSPVRRDRLIAS